ncbi:hypothetical protein GCM10027456_81110 [Kineosporia babensis]
MDIIVAVFVWIAPLALVLALIGFVLRKVLGSLPQWLFGVALVLCLGIVAWCEVPPKRWTGG